MLLVSVKASVDFKELSAETQAAMSSVIGPLKEVFTECHDAEALEALSFQSNSVKLITVEVIKETNSEAGTLRQKALRHYTELCEMFFEEERSEFMNLMKNGGCAELFRNVNEGLRDFQHCLRTSTAAV